MKITVGPATKEDIPRLEEMYSGEGLHRNLAQGRWYVHANFDYHNILVAKVDGVIQGACFWRIEGEKYCGAGWIEDMWVEKDFRGLGLAEALLRMALSDMKKSFEKDGLVLRKIFLTTQARNKAARGLYEKVGFVVCGEVDGMYEDGLLTLIYGLDARRDEA
jgi:ribosomal protein S18 acetylase RimI-like enzyme